MAAVMTPCGGGRSSLLWFHSLHRSIQILRVLLVGLVFLIVEVWRSVTFRPTSWLPWREETQGPQSIISTDGLMDRQFVHQSRKEFSSTKIYSTTLKDHIFQLTGRSVQFSSVQSLSCVQLFATPWIAARQATLSITNSRSSSKLTSIESVMPSSHLILFWAPSPPAPNPSQHQSFLMSQLFTWGGKRYIQSKHQSYQSAEKLVIWNSVTRGSRFKDSWETVPHKITSLHSSYWNTEYTNGSNNYTRSIIKNSI